MPLIIPVFADEPLFEERVRLEDRDYILRFDWNNREEAFYLGIKDQDEESLVAGIKIVANWDLLAALKSDDRLPQGVLIALDLVSGGVGPTLADFGSRVNLYYYESTEDLTIYAPT